MSNDETEGKAKLAPSICIDFDGVLHDYQGWGTELRSPREPGLFLLQALQPLVERELIKVIILTSRTNHQEIWDWLKEYGIYNAVNLVTNIKMPALAYVDDRAVDGRRDANWIIKDIIALVVTQAPQARLMGMEQEMIDLALQLSNSAKAIEPTTK